MLEIIQAPHQTLAAIAKPVPLRSAKQNSEGQVDKIDKSSTFFSRSIKSSEKKNNANLRDKSRGFEKVLDKKIIKLIEEMKETLEAAKDPQGVGLAAPQVGKSLQFFLMKPTHKSKIKVVINPKLVTQNYAEPFDKLRAGSAEISANPPINPQKSLRKRKTLEGCLSLKNIWGEVVRPPVIAISYLDEKGNQKTQTFKGFLATIVQHEIDHLNGILFTKHVLEQQRPLYRSKKTKEGKEVFEEIEI